MKNTEDALDSVATLLASDHSTGSSQAKWLLLEYGDYACPSCSEAEPVTRHLIDAFGRQLRLVFRHFPLAEHPDAELAAEAAEAAAAQDKFWPMHHLLFTNWQHLDPGALARYGEIAGLDMRRFNIAMTERTFRSRVREHRRSGEQIGLHGSPSFFLNGKVIDVSFGLERLEHAVRAVLGKE